MTRADLHRKWAKLARERAADVLKARWPTFSGMAKVKRLNELAELAEYHERRAQELDVEQLL